MCDENIVKMIPREPFIDLLLYNLKYSDNVGACYRLAYQFSIRKIFRYKCVKPGKTNTTKVERHIPVIDIEDLEILNDNTIIKIAIEEGGSPLIPITVRHQNPKTHLIAVGNEKNGIPKEILSKFDAVYTLQTLTEGSYNVSHALAIALYKFTF